MRLIDADKLEPREFYDGFVFVEAVYMDDIREMPTVDAEPIRHGHWVKENEEDTFFCVYKCSRCGGMILTDRVHLFKYCSYCGAKMIEADTEAMYYPQVEGITPTVIEVEENEID